MMRTLKSFISDINDLLDENIELKKRVGRI